MSHWARIQVDTSNRVWVVIDFNPGEGVANDSDRPFDVYMDLEVTHSRAFLSDQQIVRTLPGLNRFTTERDRALIQSTQAAVITVQPGSVLGPVAVAVLDRRAFGASDVGYEVKAILRLVENPNAARAEDVGRLISEHRQDSVLAVNYI
jgi:hypothetical protein